MVKSAHETRKSPEEHVIRPFPFRRNRGLAVQRLDEGPWAAGIDSTRQKVGAHFAAL